MASPGEAGRETASGGASGPPASLLASGGSWRPPGASLLPTPLNALGRPGSAQRTQRASPARARGGSASPANARARPSPVVLANAQRALEEVGRVGGHLLWLRGPRSRLGASERRGEVAAAAGALQPRRTVRQQACSHADQHAPHATRTRHTRHAGRAPPPALHSHSPVAHHPPRTAQPLDACRHACQRLPRPGLSKLRLLCVLCGRPAGPAVPGRWPLGPRLPQRRSSGAARRGRRAAAHRPHLPRPGGGAAVARMCVGAAPARACVRRRVPKGKHQERGHAVRDHGEAGHGPAHPSTPHLLKSHTAPLSLPPAPSAAARVSPGPGPSDGRPARQQPRCVPPCTRPRTDAQTHKTAHTNMDTGTCLPHECTVVRWARVTHAVPCGGCTGTPS
jgi:hypothetical protein